MFCRNFPAKSWNVYHCVQMNLLRENMLSMEKYWPSIFLVIETKSVRFWQRNSTTSSILGFYLTILFQEETFFLKKNKQFANCLKIPREIFKSGEKLLTTDENVSAWLKKLDSMSAQVFVKENCLFFGEWLSSKAFFRDWVDVFWTLTKKLQQIVKIVFLSVQINIFRRKTFPEKTKQFYNISDIEWSFYQKFVLKKKMVFGREISAQFSKLNSMLPERNFGENMFPKKNQLEKIFVLRKEFFFCYRICLACLSKTRPCLQLQVLRKVIFSNKKFFLDFFQNLRGKLSYFGNEPFIVYQKCVSLV